MRKNGLSCLGGAVVFVLAVCGGMFAGPVFGETFLVKDGQPRADIVIAAQPTRAVKLASAEL